MKTLPLQVEPLTTRLLRRHGEATLAEGPFHETFRLLALNVDRMLSERVGRSVLVMSALPADGRTLTATSLARALCELRPPVLLLDADPFGAGPVDSGALQEGPDISLKYRANGHANLFTYRPAADLSARSFLAEVNDVLVDSTMSGMTVVVDTPPCLQSTIAFGIAPRVSGVLYVSRPGNRRSAPHADIRAQLDLLGAHVFGVAVNEG